MERISKAVPASRPRASTVLEMLSGILQHVLVALGRADGGDDALADAGDDGVLLRAADEAVEVGAHGHAGLDLELDAVLGHAVDRSAGRRSGFGQSMTLGLTEVRTASSTSCPALGGEVDGAGAVPVERDAGLLRGDQRVHGRHDVAAGQVMGLDLVGG